MLSLAFAARVVQRALFSTSAVASKYKIKTHMGAKKRFKALPSGLFKRVSHAASRLDFGVAHIVTQGQPGRVHKNTPGWRSNHTGRTAFATPTQAKHLRRLMPNA